VYVKLTDVEVCVWYGDRHREKGRAEIRLKRQLTDRVKYGMVYSGHTIDAAAAVRDV